MITDAKGGYSELSSILNSALMQTTDKTAQNVVPFVTTRPQHSAVACCGRRHLGWTSKVPRKFTLPVFFLVVSVLVLLPT